MRLQKKSDTAGLPLPLDKHDYTVSVVLLTLLYTCVKRIHSG